MSARNSPTRAKTAAGAALVSGLTPRMVGRDSEGSGGWTAAAGALVEAFYNRRRLRSAHNFMMPVKRKEARTKQPKETVRDRGRQRPSDRPRLRPGGRP